VNDKIHFASHDQTCGRDTSTLAEGSWGGGVAEGTTPSLHSTQKGATASIVKDYCWQVSGPSRCGRKEGGSHQTLNSSRWWSGQITITIQEDSTQTRAAAAVLGHEENRTLRSTAATHFPTFVARGPRHTQTQSLGHAHSPRRPSCWCLGHARSPRRPHAGVLVWMNVVQLGRGGDKRHVLTLLVELLSAGMSSVLLTLSQTDWKRSWFAWVLGVGQVD